MIRFIYIIALLSLNPFLSRSQPLERLFIHTDKDTYLAGEILWMKLYLVDAATRRPGTLSRSAFVEILSDEQKPVLQARVALDGGTGNASLQLPFSLHSGDYLLRAYTNWMKNSPADTWFEKHLTILNTLRSNPAATRNTASPAYDIQFFPEGGNLIAGVPNHVAFRIIDSTGKSIPAEGAVINNTGDTISHIKTQRFGMGEFTLTPAQNTSYSVQIRFKDLPPSRHPLPTPEPSGYAMHVADAGDGNLRIDIHAAGEPENTTVRILTHTRRIIATLETHLAANNASFLLPKDSLPDGVSWLTLLAADNTGYMIPVAERGWFKAPTLINLSVNSDQPSYDRRENISLDLSAHDAANSPILLNGSIAVVLQDEVQTNGDQDILNYFLLSAELKGQVESPGYYFSPKNTDREQIASLLLMTQGWRRLTLSNTQPPAAGLTQPPNHYIPEYGGLLVSGHITDRRTGAPAPNITAWLSAPGRHYQLARSTSDKDGNILWDMGELFGARELVVTPATTDSNYRIEITSPFAAANPAAPANTSAQPSATIPHNTLPTPPSESLLRHSIGVQAQNAYQAALRQKFTHPAQTDTNAFYGHPDRRYNLDDYTRFTTMEEVIREYVKEVRLNNKKGDFELYVQSDQANQLFFDETPLVLVDGVPIASTNNIIHFDPLKMQKIEVVAKRYFVGGALYDGIVSYNTYQGDISGFPLDANAYTVDYDGWQLHREFYTPTYDSKEKQASRIPDLRNVLFWSGDILTGTQGKQHLTFYSSDVPGRYSVIFQGITADGKIGSTVAEFTVR
jgi:hypothetical protein